MSDKCPYCGADKYRDDYLIWECGSTRLARSPGCYERQIERLQNELIEAVAMRHGTDGKLARMQPVVDAVVAMLAIERDHRFQALSEVIEAGEMYKESK